MTGRQMTEDERRKALAIIHAVLAILARLQAYFDAMDAGTFREEDHPRAPDGKFGEGEESNKETETRPEENSGRSRNDPPVATLTGNELGQKPGESIHDAALRYYDSLANDPASRKGFGKVDFYKGSGWKKLKTTSLSAPERLKLLPAVKDVIEKGDYLGRSELKKPRNDNIVAFHYFEGNVSLNGKAHFIGVSVGEDAFGNKFYNLVKDPDILVSKKKSAGLTEFAIRRPALSKDSAGGILDPSIANAGAEINISIL
jgi:hypothetical protein